MASSQVPGKATSERDQEKARAMSISTNDPKFNTPLIPASSAVLIVHASTRIDAPAALVFRTLRNTETWRDWNNFVPRVTIRSQPPEDLATDAEIVDLVLNTSRLGSMDSEIVDGAAHPPRKSISSPSPASADNSRRASTTSVKSGDGMSAAQRYAQTQAARRNSTTSGTSGVPTSGVSSAVIAAATENPASSSSSPRPASPAPAKLVEASSTASNGGVLINHSSNTNGRTSTSSTASKRRTSLNALYGEPSIRLKVNTTMTFHCRMGLPSKPHVFKDMPFVVTEVSRPDDNDMQQHGSNTDLTRSTTHTFSRSGVYRIVWGTDHKADRHPKFMLTSQWVVEVRPLLRGDGKEESEIRIWESVKGLSAGGLRKKYQGYLFEMFAGWVLGLRDYCEAMGGAVERRDFISSGSTGR